MGRHLTKKSNNRQISMKKITAPERPWKCIQLSHEQIMDFLLIPPTDLIPPTP